MSARNTWGVYKVSRRTGEVLWRLGGKRSDFEMGKGTVFAWQHDARHHGDGLISIFDDGAGTAGRAAVAGARDQARRQAAGARAWCASTPIGRAGSTAEFMGNAQLLGNGNVVVGWGSEPYVTEFAPDGAIVLDVEAAARRPELPRVPLAVGGPSVDAEAVCRSARGRTASTSAGTARPRSPPGSCSQARPAATLAARGHGAEARVRDGARDAAEGFATPPWSRSTGTAHELSRSKTVRI